MKINGSYCYRLKIWQQEFSVQNSLFKVYLLLFFLLSHLHHTKYNFVYWLLRGCKILALSYCY